MAPASGHDHGLEVATKDGALFVESLEDLLIADRSNQSWHSRVTRKLNGLLLLLVTLLAILLCLGLFLPIFRGSETDVRFGTLFRRREYKSIVDTVAVITDDPPTQYQKNMLDAVQAAMKFISTQRESGIILNVTLRIIQASSSSQDIEVIKSSLNGHTFIDLRMERFSEEILSSLHLPASESNSTIAPEAQKIPTFVLPFSKIQSEAPFGAKVISVSGSTETRTLAMLSKMSDVGLKFILPILDVASSRQREALKIFKQESKSLDIIVFPEVEYNSSDFRLSHQAKIAAREIVLQLEPILMRFPEASIIAFGGKEVISLLEAISVKTGEKKNVSESLEQANGERQVLLECSKRAWYFPDAIYWDQELKSSEKAFQMAKHVGLFSAVLLGQNYSTTFRRRQMAEIARHSGNAAHMYSALAFDSILTAVNAILRSNGAHDVFFKGITGSLSFDSSGNREGPLDYARVMLTPPMVHSEKVKVEVVQNSPWLIDGVVKVQNGGGNPSGSRVVKVGEVGSGHFLTRSHFDFIRSWKSSKCPDPKITVTAFDPFNYEKIERAYDVSNFPDGLVMPDDHGYAVEIKCKAASSPPAHGDKITNPNGPEKEITDIETGDDVVASKSSSTSELTINFVCPSKDPLVRLPCVSAKTTGDVKAVREKRHADNRWTPVDDGSFREFAEIPREHAQRYLDVMTQKDSASDVKLTDLEGWAGVDAWWEDPVDRERRQDIANDRQADENNAFQRRKSSIPGGYEGKGENRKKFHRGHDRGQAGAAVSDQGGNRRRRKPATRNTPQLVPVKGNATGVAPYSQDAWSPKLIAEMSETFGIPESEVEHILKASQGSFMPSIMRKDVVAAPPPPPTTPKPKYPIPPYAKIIVNALPAMAGCSGAGTTCIVCTMVTEGVGSTSVPCIGTCNASIWANCMGMMGLMFTKVFKDNSVICSELFRQGRLDLPTYMADSQFGARLRATSPEAMVGYHFMAKPVVWAMQRSSTVTNMVEAVAKPWMKQMAFEEGFAAEGDSMGATMMAYGVPFCAGVGKTVAFVQAYFPQLSVSVLSLVALKFAK